MGIRLAVRQSCGASDPRGIRQVSASQLPGSLPAGIKLLCL